MVGALDACLALVFWELRGGRAIRIFQSIAAGLLGRASYAGGLPTASLGFFLHFFIAGSIVTTYYLASRRIDVLTRRPIACGLVYGIGVYFFMSRVVIPLSAIPRSRSFDWPWFWASVIGHALLVGLPSALVAQRVSRPRPAERMAA
jgi:uncharacterized membrane protein YagU involved in acid resistance